MSGGYSRVQKKGQVTIPVEMRERMGLKEGDLVRFTETSDGILLSPQEVVATRAMDAIAKLLDAQGITLDDLIESGRVERGRILDESTDKRRDA